MNRLIGGIAAALLFVACSAGPGATGRLPTNPLGTGPVDTGAIGTAAGAAKAALCDASSNTSLKSLATQVATVDPNGDTTTLQANLGTAATNLQSLQVSGDQSTLKDAAATAIQQLQAALANPSTMAEVKTNAVTALDALNTNLCM